MLRQDPGGERHSMERLRISNGWPIESYTGLMSVLSYQSQINERSQEPRAAMPGDTIVENLRFDLLCLVLSLECVIRTLSGQCKRRLQ